MSRNWDDVRNSIHEFFSAAAEKTDEFIQVGRRKLSIAEIKRNIAAQYAELGGRAYHLISRGEGGQVETDADVEALVSRIQKLEGDLKAKEMEIEEIKSREAQSAEAETVSATEASNMDEAERVAQDSGDHDVQ